MCRQGYRIICCLLAVLLAPNSFQAMAVALLPGQADGHSPTGEFIAGVPVIDALDAVALPAGKHKFYFRAGIPKGNQPFDIPILVVRGAHPGKQLMITAALHGDELNGIAVIHKLFAEVDPEKLSGTLIAVPGVNQTGLTDKRREFRSGRRMPLTDLNRIFPGQQDGRDSAKRFVGALWHRVLKNNADLAVDIHTQTTGLSYPLFVFADFRSKDAKAMAFTLMPDLIKIDRGQKGSLETTYMMTRIPAVTFEVGAPGKFEAALVSRAVAGLRNLMRQQKMLEGPVLPPSDKLYVGKKHFNVLAKEAGIAHIRVKLLDTVAKGQLIATTSDAFGRETGRYYAPHSGRILSLATSPLCEKGSTLVRILH